MNVDYLTLLLEHMKEDAMSECKKRIGDKNADFWYHMGRSNAYQYILDTIKIENKTNDTF